MLSKWMRLLSVIVWLFPQAIYAVYVNDLDQANLTITNHSPATLNAVLPQAMSQVLIKMSGNVSTGKLPTIQSELAHAKQYLQSYSYTIQNIAGKDELLLQAKFNNRSIIKLLHHLHQPIWQANRPLILLWLQIVEKNNNVLIGDDSRFSLGVQREAKLRGLPIILPMMDLQDQGLINGLGGPFNLEKLQTVSVRYQASVILASRLSLVRSQQWQAQWLLYFNGEPVQWSETANDITELLNRGINKATDLLANQFAVDTDPQKQSEVMLQFSGIHNLKNYVAAQRYLKSLPIIAGMQLKKMNTHHIIWQLQVMGGERALVETLAKNHHLQAVNVAHTQQQNTICYQWK